MVIFNCICYSCASVSLDAAANWARTEGFNKPKEQVRKLEGFNVFSVSSVSYQPTFYWVCQVRTWSI
jgi:hypothetical protein